jgi:O-antigen/teichoic acid export membrane protein
MHPPVPTDRSRLGVRRRAVDRPARLRHSGLVAGPADTAAGLPADAVDSPEAGRKFVRGGAARIVAYGAAIASSVAVIPFVTRHLHPDAYGRVTTVAGLILIAGILTEGGLGTVGIREYSNLSGERRRDFMRSLLGLRLALSILGALAIFAFALIAGYPRVEVEGTAIATLGVVLTNVQVTLSIPLTAGLRYGWLAVLDLAGPLTTAVTLVVLVVTGAPLLAFFAAPLAAYLVITGLTAWLVHGTIPLRPKIAPESWRPLLRSTFLFSAATALGTIYFRVVLVAMSLLTPNTPAGHTTVGVFGLAFRSLDVLSTLPWLLVVSVWPILVRAARDDSNRLRYALGRLIEGNLLLGGWISLLLVSGGPFAAGVLGGPQYPGAGEVMRILGAGVGATFLLAVFAYALLSQHMLRAMIVINVAILALSILLSVLLIPGHGARGGAVVTVSLEGTLACLFGGTLFVAHPELRPGVGRLARILAALALAFTVALAAPVSSLASAVIGSVVLAIAVALLRAAPPEMMDAIRPSRR